MPDITPRGPAMIAGVGNERLDRSRFLLLH